MTTTETRTYADGVAAGRALVEAAVEETLRARTMRSPYRIVGGKPLDVVAVDDIRLALEDPHGALLGYQRRILAKVEAAIEEACHGT